MSLSMVGGYGQPLTFSTVGHPLAVITRDSGLWGN